MSEPARVRRGPRGTRHRISRLRNGLGIIILKSFIPAMTLPPLSISCCFCVSELQVAALIALTLVFGGLNRVMGKIISVPCASSSPFPSPLM